MDFCRKGVAMKLLLVEDETKLSDALAYILKKSGYIVDVALDGETGLNLALTGIHDVIILDRMLPVMDGITILKELRSQKLDTPVLFLTARDSPKDRVEGLDAGADDYLIKPFSTDEFLARIRALARRRNKELISNTLTLADLALNPLRNEVKKGNEVIRLSVTETQLLELLMRNHGQVMKKDFIFFKIWGYCEVDFANVDLYIHYLRKKLGYSYIKTIRGVGYCFQPGGNNVS